MLFRWVVVTLLTCAATAGVLFAEDNDEVGQELRRLKNEIRRVKAQRTEEAQQVKKENWEYADYQKRTAKRKNVITARTDSLQTQLQLLNTRNDSLNARLETIRTAIEEENLRKKSLSGVIIQSVESVKTELERFPPMIREQYSGSLTYLIGEVKGGTVENTEALHRLMRIVRDVRTVAQEIQVIESASPVAELRGTVSRLRIGAVFEAVYDDKSNTAFLWTPAEDTLPEKWHTVKDESAVTAIKKAILMREGKVVPELLALPFGMRDSVAEGSGTDE